MSSTDEKWIGQQGRVTKAAGMFSEVCAIHESYGQQAKLRVEPTNYAILVWSHATQRWKRELTEETCQKAKQLDLWSVVLRGFTPSLGQVVPRRILTSTRQDGISCLWHHHREGQEPGSIWTTTRQR